RPPLPARVPAPTPTPTPTPPLPAPTRRRPRIRTRVVSPPPPREAETTEGARQGGAFPRLLPLLLLPIPGSLHKLLQRSFLLLLLSLHLLPSPAPHAPKVPKRRRSVLDIDIDIHVQSSDLRPPRTHPRRGRPRRLVDAPRRHQRAVPVLL
ncbi:hypothetical protein C8R46DRAFT_1117107, partial [Mycena filopes]